ncbi:MAG TPA: HepT-like ribonuclease domain-containing protein, partial [Bryobacteraceae bacterium]|nr:HepT-like ribonuclease domain-containing protein [Bryobacteraceae bacterium]
MTVAAAERKLQVISEAAIRLGGEAEQRIPAQPRRNTRGIGNQLRHTYERIDLNTIGNAVTDDLPPFKAAVRRALNPPRATSSAPDVRQRSMKT